MGVVINALGHVIVDYIRHIPMIQIMNESELQVAKQDGLPDINTSASNICSNQYVLFSSLEAVKSIYPANQYKVIELPLKLM